MPLSNREYVPSERSINLRYKLILACQDELNKDMSFCQNLQPMLRKGTEFYMNARTLYSGFMETTYRLLSGGLLYEGMQNAIFTEDRSEEYCIQSYTLTSRIPVNHPNAGLDLKKILKLRVYEDSHLCLQYHSNPHENKPVFLTLAEGQAKLVEQLRWWSTPKNLSHPIYVTLNSTANMIEAQVKANATVDFAAASKAAIEALLPTAVISTESDHFNQSYFHRGVAFYGRLASEPVRIRTAQQLFEAVTPGTITPLQALVITQRLNVNDPLVILDAFKNVDATFVTTDSNTYHTFESFNDMDETVLQYLDDNGLSLTLALNYMNYLEEASLKDVFFLRNDSFRQAKLQNFQDQIALLDSCGPYNATDIMKQVTLGDYAYTLKGQTEQCREFSRALEHTNGFHYHDLIPHDFHSQAHKLEDSMRDHNVSMNMMLAMMFFLLLSSAYGAYKLTAKPLKKCTARFFNKNRHDDNNLQSPENRRLLFKSESTEKRTTRVFFSNKKSGNVRIEEEVTTKTIKKASYKDMV